MMNYIAAGDGQFINLAAIVLINDTSTDDELKATLTTITADEIDVHGEDAERLFERIEMIAHETNLAESKLRQVAAMELPTQ